MNKLSVMNLQKHFRSRTVVKNLSLEVNAGEIVGLLGPNGAGKTTAFYMIVGLIPVSGGQIFFDGKDITNTPTYVRARFGLSYLPQDASIFRKLTVKENILAILQLRKDLSKDKQHIKLNTLLNEFHIAHLKDSLGISLSGGERRRVEIARALAIEPKFILLDEPFAGIDPISVIDLKNIIGQLCKKNIGVLITDHNVRETLDVCDRAYIVNEGTVLCSGAPNAILNNQQVREIYLGKDFML